MWDNILEGTGENWIRENIPLTCFDFPIYSLHY